MEQDRRSDGPERREEVRRNSDEWIVNHALSGHEWMKRVATASLICVVVLGVLDGVAVFQLEAANSRARQLATTAHSLGISNRHLLRAIQADRRRRLRDSRRTARDTCKAVKRTNNALIAFLLTNERLSRHLRIPGVTTAQRQRSRRLEDHLIQTLTITCTKQGQPKAG